MSLKSWLLLGPALGLALGQQSTYPTNLTFERWTAPEGELIQLDGRGQTSRPYRVTALSRLDPNRPGFLLQPLDDQGSLVRTYDQKVPLNSLEETRRWVYYNPTSVAYLKIDYTHSGLKDVVLRWDGQALYSKENQTDISWQWGVLWTLTFGTIGLLGIPSRSGSFETTLPIPLDGQTHVLYFGGGGNCLAFGGWEGYYKVDASRMQPGKIYWVKARNECRGVSIYGDLMQVANEDVQLQYRVEGLPGGRIKKPKPDGSFETWALSNDRAALRAIAAPGYYPSEGSFRSTNPWDWWLGETAPGVDPGSSGKLFLPPGEIVGATNDPDRAAVLPLRTAWNSVSWRYPTVERQENGNTVLVLGPRVEEVNYAYCGDWNEHIDPPRCEVDFTTVPFKVSNPSATPTPLTISRGTALSGSVGQRVVEGQDTQGNRIRFTVLEAYPQRGARSYTVTEHFTCAGSPCP
ncbi:MAG: hypothetical protein C4342_07500 [Armatimonadota bacterium]